MTGFTRSIPNRTELFSVQNQSLGLECDCPIDEFKQAVFPVAYLFIFTLGLTANCASLWVFLRMCGKGRRLTTVNLYMVNLLVSDLMLVCTLPLRATYYLLNSHWPFGDIACRLASCVFYINMYGSVYFLLALSVMRYLAVCHPHKFMQLDNGPCGWVGCVLIWLFVSLTSAPLLISKTRQDGGEKVRCLELGKGLSSMIHLNSAAMVLGFILPFVVISVCYMCVLRDLCRPRAGKKGNRSSRRKSFALVGLGLLIFVVCFLPYHVVRTIFLEAEHQAQKNGCQASCSVIVGIRKAAVVTLCLAAGNSCLDPFLFFFVGEKFRDGCMRNRNARRRRSGERHANAQELQVAELTEN